MITQEMHDHLVDKILPFWMGLMDREHGGFYGWMDTDLQVDRFADKGCILHARILWFFSASYELLQDEQLLPYVRHAYEFVRDHCVDHERGGVYWSLDYLGNPLDTTKHTYNQAFAVYALSACHQATGWEEALEHATRIYQIIEEKCFDEFGYKEALDIQFVETDNDKLSENGVMAERTMNTLLHCLEAYTVYYQQTANKEVKVKIEWMLDLIADKIFNKELRRQEVFFDRHMNSILDLHSYGHDIETAWLVDRALEVIKEEKYTDKLSKINRILEDQIYQVAYRNHSLENECDQGVVSSTRIWWVQAEAVVGFYNAYEKTNDVRYRDASCDIWEFIKAHVVDKRDGAEWFWSTDAEGNPNWKQPIVEPWKCPYHNGRMCIEMMRRTGYVTQ